MNYLFSSLLAALTITTTFGQPIPNFAEANFVLGQADFTSRLRSAIPTASSMLYPSAVAIDPVSGKVFVADSGDNRILRYPNVAALTNGAAAEFVFGQLTLTENADFLSNGIVATGLFLDRQGRLWVADAKHNRVLMFAAASTRRDWFADKIFGQPNSATISPDKTRAKMSSPNDICVDGNDRLWVADTGNNRVLRFDSISNRATGALADGVLGQANYTTDTRGSGAAGLQLPTGVSVSQTGALFVSCLSGNRVLRFDHAATLGDGAAANAVLGQPDFNTTSIIGPTAARLYEPVGIWITADDSLWVTDRGYNRILRFNNASTKSSGAAADGVVGQPDFVTDTGGTSAREIYGGSHPFVDGSGNLWFPEPANSRVLRFPLPPQVIVPPIITPPAVDKTSPVLVLTRKIPKATAKASLLLKGTASDASGIKSVQYRLGKGALKPAKGTITWSFNVKLLKGKNTVTLFATDTAGNVSIAKIIKITRK
jgi:sugar lactone lactonase YvrE